MYSALRPYVTTGVALVGASVIVAAPITAPPPVPVAAPTAVHDAQVRLTALGTPDLDQAAQQLQLLFTSAPAALGQILDQLGDIADGSVPLEQAFDDTLGHLRGGITETATAAAFLLIAVTGAEFSDINDLGFGDALVFVAATAVQQFLKLPAPPIEFVQGVRAGFSPVDMAGLITFNELVAPPFAAIELLGIGLNNDLPAPIGGDPDVQDGNDEGFVLPIVRQITEVRSAIAGVLLPSGPVMPFAESTDNLEVQNFDQDSISVNDTKIGPTNTVTLTTPVDELASPNGATDLSDGNMAVQGGDKGATTGSVRNGFKQVRDDVRKTVNGFGEGVRKLAGLGSDKDAESEPSEPSPE
jgi:hypothetical protein